MLSAVHYNDHCGNVDGDLACPMTNLLRLCGAWSAQLITLRILYMVGHDNIYHTHTQYLNTLYMHSDTL